MAVWTRLRAGARPPAPPAPPPPAKPDARVTVASKGLITYPFLDIEFDNLKGEKKFNMQHAYYHAKQAQVMFTFDLAEHLKGMGVTVNCVRVGNVAIPDTRLDHLPKFLLKMYEMKRKFALTPEKMAETYVWLAGDPSMQDVTGGILGRATYTRQSQ